MALSPDVIVEFVTGSCPSQEEIDDLTKLVRQLFFPPSLPIVPSPPPPQAVCAPNTNVTPPASVLTIGLWLEADGFSDAQRRSSLAASSFIFGDRTAALLLSTSLIKLMAAASWAATDKHQGRVTLSDTIDVDVSSSGILTKVTGTYDVPVLPDISFTYTVRESLSLNPPGQSPALLAHASTNLDVSQGGIIADSLLVALLSPILGAIVFFGEEIEAGTEDPKESGVGTSLANAWPSVVLISQPSIGKVTFAWSDLTIDANGVRTLGTFELGPRSPQVWIAGPTAVSFLVTQPGALRSYSVELRDLRTDNATVVWSGAAQGGGMSTEVTFDRAGTFPIYASVTDTDNMSATGALTVTVTVTRKGGGGGGETP